jgi:hypothetical protein
MSLRNYIKFQKTLALAASASNPFEAKAAELAARRSIATPTSESAQTSCVPIAIG